MRSEARVDFPAGETGRGGTLATERGDGEPAEGPVRRGCRRICTAGRGQALDGIQGQGPG